MRILLDTHILLWAMTADEKLPKVAKQLIEDENCVAAGYNPLKVEVEHIALLSTLKRLRNSPKHNDPFDRMLIAQSKKEGIKFMTHDELIPQYNEDCVLAV